MFQGQSYVCVRICLTYGHYILVILTNEEFKALCEDWEHHVTGAGVDPPISSIFSGDSHPYGDKFAAIKWAVKVDDIVGFNTVPLESLTQPASSPLNPLLSAGVSGFPR